MKVSAGERQKKAQEALERRMQQDFEAFVGDYPIDHPFPAKVVASAENDRPLRTNNDLVQHRLIEAGVMFDDAQRVNQVMEACSRFIENMNQTQCFRGVHVSVDEDPSNGKQALRVILNERNWYKLYIGGGLKQDGLFQSGGDSLLPKVQFETSGTLLNLTGHLDTTTLQYFLDQTSSATVRFSHERPLYTLFAENSDWYNTILALDKGSQICFGLNAVLDTVDFEWTRSYKEYQRLLSMRIASSGKAANPEMVEGGYNGLDWSLLFRDAIPRRHASQPFALDASPEVVSQSGPSVKHSVKYEFHTNGSSCDDRFSPSEGVDLHTKLELAGPPGDVGFVKWEGGVAGHMPVEGMSQLSIHGSLRTGFLNALSFGGLCGPPTMSDRFYLGGPLQLRGFVPSGVGPRAKTVR